MFVMPACYNAGDTIPFPFDSYDADGASVTISGLAVTDIEVYKGSSMTQRASDNGYTLLDTDGIDLDGVTGIHGFQIDTSDNSDSGFWTDGSTYRIVVDAITVDGQTVRFQYLLPLGYLLRPATAGRKLTVSSGGAADANATQFGGTNGTFSGGRPEVSLFGDLTSTMKASVNAEADTALTDYGALKPTVAGRTLNVNSLGQADADVMRWNSAIVSSLVSGLVPARMSSAANGVITSSVIADDAITAAKFDETTAFPLKSADAGATAVSRLTEAQVNTQADQALADYDGPTKSEMDTGFANLNDVSTSDIETAAGNALTAYDPPTRAEANDDKNEILAGIPSDSDNAAELLASGDIDGYSVEETLKLCLAALAGKLSGAEATTIEIRAADDSKARITATVDVNGNRSEVTLDAED